MNVNPTENHCNLDDYNSYNQKFSSVDSLHKNDQAHSPKFLSFSLVKCP